jgi:hypothetical protein
VTLGLCVASHALGVGKCHGDCYCLQFLVRVAEPGSGLRDILPGLVSRATLRDQGPGPHRPRAMGMARPGGGLAGSGGHLGDALHRHAGIHHSRTADPLQRSAHDPLDAGRDRCGGNRPDHCQQRQRPPAAAAHRRCHRRGRGRQHALHGHGRDEHAGQRALQGVTVPSFDRDRDRGRHRGAVGRHPGTRDNRDYRGRADHGCRGERHALHRYGRHVPACRSGIEHGEHVRQHGFQLHRAAAVRHQPADLRADPGHLAVADRGRDR